MDEAPPTPTRQQRAWMVAQSDEDNIAGAACEQALARLDYLERGWADGFVPEGRAVKAEAEIEQLARDVISLAEDGGMPDSYQQTDQRMIRARAVLTEQEDS